MKFAILTLCLVGTMVSSGYGFRFNRRELDTPATDAATPATDAATPATDAAAPATDAAAPATDAPPTLDQATKDVKEYVPYVPDDDPYDINAIDQENLGTLGKLLTGVVDLTRGLVKGLESSVTSLYTLLIPSVRIILAGAKIKVCRPQSRTEVIVWFVKEFVNVQLSADLGVAQIPLCLPREEPKSLKKWNITYDIPDNMKGKPGMDMTGAELLANPEASLAGGGQPKPGEEAKPEATPSSELEGKPATTETPPAPE